MSGAVLKLFISRLATAGAEHPYQGRKDALTLLKGKPSKVSKLNRLTKPTIEEIRFLTPYLRPMTEI